MTLLQPELLAHLAKEFPDAVAWKDVSTGDELTILRWHERSNRLGHGLRARGVTHGDRVILALTEQEPLEWLVSYMAIHKCGAIAVPLNTRLSGPEMLRIVAHALPKAFIVGGTVMTSCPTLADGAEVVGVTGGVAPAGRRWEDLLADDVSDVGVALDGGDMADVVYTSGTTGAPKGVAVRHDGLASLDRVPTSWHGLAFLTSSPFSTTSGSLLVCGPMRGGLSGWFLPRFQPATWLDTVTASRPVAAFLVPAMVQLLVADPAFEQSDLSSLVVVNIGSAPIAADTLRRFAAHLPKADVTCGYGMTEFGAVTSMPMGDAGRHLGSVGQPLPGVEIRIAGVDRDAHATGLATGPAPGEVGEVLVRGARPPRSYLGEPELTASTWKDGWLQSGDLGYLDGDGFLFITGRLKETIIRGGHNIMPGEVEGALFAHPSVLDAAVAGVPHPVLGEDVAAWVVARAASQPSTDELQAFLHERLADYKVPRRITFVDALPRNEAGKLQKSLLVLTESQRSTT